MKVVETRLNWDTLRHALEIHLLSSFFYAGPAAGGVLGDTSGRRGPARRVLGGPTASTADLFRFVRCTRKSRLLHQAPKATRQRLRPSPDRLLTQCSARASACEQRRSGPSAPQTLRGAHRGWSAQLVPLAGRPSLGRGLNVSSASRELMSRDAVGSASYGAPSFKCETGLALSSARFLSSRLYRLSGRHWSGESRDRFTPWAWPSPRASRRRRRR